MKVKDYQMREGERIFLNANMPVISVVGTGAQTYIWVGNSSETSKACFATMSGVKTLEKLACDILNALGHDGESIKKMIYKKNGK
jgi:hypothetical protein